MLQGRDSFAKFCELGSKPLLPEKKQRQPKHDVAEPCRPGLSPAEMSLAFESPELNSSPTPHSSPAPSAEEPSSHPSSPEPPAGQPCGKPWVPGNEYVIIPDKLFFRGLARALEPRDEAQWVEGDKVYLSVDKMFAYFPFCQDFGPFNLAVVWRFDEMLVKTIKDLDAPGVSFVLCTSEAPEACTNVACLIASWLILELNWTVERAWGLFQFTAGSPFVPFGDTTNHPKAFPLHVEDVLSGLYKAQKSGILSLEGFDIDLYEYADHPLVADLHEVVPGRFMAFKGPTAKREVVADQGIVKLEPGDYVQLFKVLGVSTVLRLNETEYDEGLFTKEGFKHADIYFDDCSVPDALVLAAFFVLCRQTEGAIAVHCKAGLGRTGTLIAAWLMRKYQFTAREAVGYLRVVRPGSVIGPQQHFLEAAQEELWAMGDPDTCEESGGALCRLGIICKAHGCFSRRAAPKTHRSPSASRGYVRAALLAIQNTEAMLRNTASRLKQGS